jgi:hypothetical protein
VRQTASREARGDWNHGSTGKSGEEEDSPDYSAPISTRKFFAKFLGKVFGMMRRGMKKAILAE